jgi:hypothetical protein
MPSHSIASDLSSFETPRSRRSSGSRRGAARSGRGGRRIAACSTEGAVTLPRTLEQPEGLRVRGRVAAPSPNYAVTAAAGIRSRCSRNSISFCADSSGVSFSVSQTQAGFSGTS